MATEMNEISDVEELIRQAGLDASDTGEKIVDYFKSKRAAQQTRGRLYDGSDNPINFRLDNLQPVQLPQTSRNQPQENSPVKSPNATQPSCVVMVKPLSDISQEGNRMASFVSPEVVVPRSPVHMSIRRLPNVTPPSSRSTVHQYKRRNQMKCEAIRNATQLASSTPIAGESSERQGNNLLDFRETISPIYEDQEHGTPQRVPRSSNVQQGRPVDRPGPSTSSARSINTPVPATQDVPDAMDQYQRENTPPRDENRVIVVPETPSPVRRSPRAPCTPLSGLTLQHRPDVRSSFSTPSQRSILKNPDRSISSARNRVSFSEKLTSVRMLTPGNSSDDSEITSDESEDEGTKKGELRNKQLVLNILQRSNSVIKLQRSLLALERNQLPSNPVRSPENVTKGDGNSKNNGTNRAIEESVREGKQNAQQARMLFGSKRSEAIEDLEEPMPATPVANKRSNNRTNGNVINMIMDDWNEPTTEHMEVDDADHIRDAQIVNHTINKSLPITNIDTPRTVIMDIFDPPSAFCDDSQQGDLDSSSNELNAEPMASVAEPRTDQSDSSRKRKQDSSSQRGTIDENEPDVPLTGKISKLSKNVTQSKLLPAERIVSVDSPDDHIPRDMIDVVDMIHSRVNSEIMASESENDRRTTLNIPSKRRNTKLKVDAETEMYFKTVEKACSQDHNKNKQRKDRRKLFAQKASEAQGNNSDSDEPQPLPLTQDVVDAEQQQQQEIRSVIKPLSVLVKRLSAGTIAEASKSTPMPKNATKAVEIDVPCDQSVESPIKDQQNEQCEKSDESPFKEKQNEEQNEKGDLPKITHKKRPIVDNSEHRGLVAEKTATQKPKRDRKKKTTRTIEKNDMRESNLMMDKLLKNVSNEIRHQIESEGPRRSHRNRRLAADVLRNNPESSCHDPPKYVMPTIKDVLKYCQLSDMVITNGKAKGKSKSSGAGSRKNTAKSQPNGPATVSSEIANEKQKRDRPRKNVAQKERFDSDGFRVPPVPSDEPGPSTKADSKTNNRSTETNASGVSGVAQGVSIDSGLSSEVMMSDDVSDVPQPEERPSSKQKTPANEQPTPSCSSASASSNEIMAEKRKTLDWMMMLMENRQKQPAVLPMVGIQGFTHLSLEHLVFEEREGIEYSFYVYSNGDNFGFLRFPPNTEKRTTRTKRCSLKFLILNGSLKFIINESVVNAVGGDFLMIPASSSYRIVNGSDTTLMFMIKTSESSKTVSEKGG
uniref:Mif2/CENP-C cupin domain-containing protein n=1 Tax=Anopheles culicifacies TaxID=139723 RepID=A0A182MI05_9DIPT